MMFKRRNWILITLVYTSPQLNPWPITPVREVTSAHSIAASSITPGKTSLLAMCHVGTPLYILLDMFMRIVRVKNYQAKMPKKSNEYWKQWTPTQYLSIIYCRTCTWLANKWKPWILRNCSQRLGSAFCRYWNRIWKNSCPKLKTTRKWSDQLHHGVNC